MNSKTETETIADILAEMRGAWGAATPTAEDLAIYAGRLEAAAARERTAHINDIHDALYAATRLPGNAAALRSALEDTQDLLKHFTRNGGMLADAFALHMRDNDAALAAPARNCDSCDDVEAVVASCMQAIDAAWHEIDTIRATISWMLAPAKPKTEGESDGGK